MPKKVVGTVRRGRMSVPLLKSQIEEAQRNTNSNRQAAIWLNVSYERYKRYAKIYGLFDQHANPLGLGTTKGFASRPSSVSLRDIFANKHPHYSMIRLKWRMVARGMLTEACGMCGFCEKRVTDNKMPLMLTFKNKLHDYTRANLWLLCYNCMFLTTGAPWAAHKDRIKTSLTDPDFKPSKNDELRFTDSLDTDMDKELNEFTDESWKNEIMKELGR
jgi:hypothetical protein